MTSNFKKIVAATTGVALGLAVIDAVPAQAAIITYDFLVETNSQSFPGFFSYNDADPAENLGYGLEIPVTDFEWNFSGITYTDENVGRRIRRDFPNPLGVGVIVQPADFYLGQPFNPYQTLPGLNFGAVIQPPFLTRIEGNRFDSGGSPFIEGTVTYTLRSVQPDTTSIPESCNIAGLSLLGLCLLLKKTSQKSSESTSNATEY